jgi:cell division protein FtsN
LTFYETLSKGNKAVIGSGLNPRRPDDPLAVKPAPLPAPSVQPQPQKAMKPAAPAPADNQGTPGEKPGSDGKAAVGKPEKEAAVKKVEQGSGTFSVQIASYSERREAEGVKARVIARGLAAYIVESNLPGKGLWYRVRVGRHLDQQGANELAKKAGKGAIVVPE